MEAGLQFIVGQKHQSCLKKTLSTLLQLSGRVAHFIYKHKVAFLYKTNRYVRLKLACFVSRTI